MNKNLPSHIRKPKVIEYDGEFKLLYTEFNEWNGNESLRIRKVREEVIWDDCNNCKTVYFVTIDKERYDISGLVVERGN